MKKSYLLGSFLFIATGITNIQAQTLQIMEKNFEAAPVRDEKIEAFLKEKQIYDAKVSPEGIYYVVNQLGEGNTVHPGEFVSVHYTGKLFNGNVFDSSVERGEPITFKIGIGQVIQGWEKGIPLFKTGGKGTLYLPSSLAYGERGAGGIIPPNSPLIFDIEVIETIDNETYMERQKALQLKMQAEADARKSEQNKIDRAIIEKYAADHQLKVQYSPSGIAYIMHQEGTGENIKPGQTATVHYTGKFLDGSKFDSSKDRNQPFPVQVGANRVIQGWELGLQLLKKGSSATLILPSSLAYGERGAGASIRPNTVLIFDIDVLDVK